MFKRLKERISRQSWPAHVKTPLVALVYLMALGFGLLLLVVCATIVLVLAPALINWLSALFT